MEKEGNQRRAKRDVPHYFAALRSVDGEAASIRFDRVRYTAHRGYKRFREADDVVIVLANRPLVLRQRIDGSEEQALKTPQSICIVSGPVEGMNNVAAGRSDVLQIRIPHCLMEASAAALGIAYRPDMIRRTFCRRDERLRAVADLLWEEMQTTARLEGLAPDIYARTLAGFLLSHYLDDDAQNDGRERGGLSGRALRLVREEIEATLDQEISLARLADVASLSSFHFCREFKRSLGMSPFRYVLEARCARAMELLEANELKVIEIALNCGFSSPQSFARAFRRVLGVSPSRYRAEALEREEMRPEPMP